MIAVHLIIVLRKDVIGRILPLMKLLAGFSVLTEVVAL